MRRNDREVTEETEIRKVLDECKIVHLGFQDGGRVFVVPVNYGYSYEGGKLTVYFHGADAGLKRELAESNPVIGFEIDNGGAMGRAEKACDYTEYYHSIIGSGPVSVVKDREEKKRILTISWNARIKSISSLLIEWQRMWRCIKSRRTNLPARSITCKIPSLPLSDKKGSWCFKNLSFHSYEILRSEEDIFPDEEDGQNIHQGTDLFPFPVRAFMTV